MSLIPVHCIEFEDKRAKCILTEHGKKYELNNLSELVLRKVRVDKCIAQLQYEKRCDFLVDILESKRVFFVELKGGELNKAVRQIIDSINYLIGEYANFQIDARIVGSRDVPGFINTPDYKRLFKIIKNTNGTIKRSTKRILTESI